MQVKYTSKFLESGVGYAEVKVNYNLYDNGEIAGYTILLGDVDVTDFVTETITREAFHHIEADQRQKELF